MLRAAQRQAFQDGASYSVLLIIIPILRLLIRWLIHRHLPQRASRIRIARISSHPRSASSSFANFGVQFLSPYPLWNGVHSGSSTQDRLPIQYPLVVMRCAGCMRFAALWTRASISWVRQAFTVSAKRLQPIAQDVHPVAMPVLVVNCDLQSET